MKLFKFYKDFNTGQNHFLKHNVSESEIIEFFNDINYFEHKRKDNSFIGIGKLLSNRYLKIIYRKESKETYFIIIAYDIEDQTWIDYIDKNLEDQ